MAEGMDESGRTDCGNHLRSIPNHSGRRRIDRAGRPEPLTLGAIRRHHTSMTDTLLGVSQRTADTAGTLAVIAVFGTAMALEPELQARGYGTVALAIYVLALPVLVWSLLEKLREIRTD